MVTDEHAPRHTHDGEPMRRILRAGRPDLVFADHGFAGAAIEQAVDAVSIADVNDPALIVARAQGRTGPIDRDGRQRPARGVLALLPGDRLAAPVTRSAVPARVSRIRLTCCDPTTTRHGSTA